MRIRFKSLAVAAVALAGMAPPLGAQDAAISELQVGDRVRTRVAGERIVGTVVSSDDPLRISTESQIVLVPLSPGLEIQRSLGPRTPLAGFMNGTALGLLAGAATGAVVGAASGDDTEGLFQFTAAEKAVGLGIVLGAGGAVVGGIIGAVSPGERWQDVSLILTRAAPYTTPEGAVGIAFRLNSR
ncbi:MAG TPA: hypothetical protein VMN78_02890 [Longimicrobiales bacterium]|nr:hypothetical protein [Longimicrobiales bacterium]